MKTMPNPSVSTPRELLFRALGLSLRRLLSRRCLWLVIKCVLAAMVLAVVLWLLANNLFLYWIGPWLQIHFPSSTVHWSGLLLFIFLSTVLMAWLIAPLTALLAGQFTDMLAEIIEKEDYPADPPGTGLSNMQSFKVALRFMGLSLLCNLLALPFLLVPVLNVLVFFLINGYLLGREYFQFAAARFRSLPQALQYYRAQRGIVFVGGLFIAAVVAIPVLNILAPLFAAALMVHLHKLLSARDILLKQVKTTANPP